MFFNPIVIECGWDINYTETENAISLKFCQFTPQGFAYVCEVLVIILLPWHHLWHRFYYKNLLVEHMTSFSLKPIFSRLCDGIKYFLTSDALMQVSIIYKYIWNCMTAYIIFVYMNFFGCKKTKMVLLATVTLHDL